jgi:hypothetical protein
MSLELDKMDLMKTKEPETIRVLEWSRSAKQNKTVEAPDPVIFPDTYQVLEWILRQALIDFGFKIGFEVRATKIRSNAFASTEKYVAAILSEIEKQEKQRRKRFKKAIDLYEHWQRDEDPDPHYIRELYDDIGASGTNAATWAKFVTMERPQNLLRYGFEQVYYPTTPLLMAVLRSLSELKIKNENILSAKQEKALRARFPGIGRFLQKTEAGEWMLDFSKSPLVRTLIFCSVAVYRPLPSK